MQLFSDLCCGFLSFFSRKRCDSKSPVRKSNLTSNPQKLWPYTRPNNQSDTIFFLRSIYAFHHVSKTLSEWLKSQLVAERMLQNTVESRHEFEQQSPLHLGLINRSSVNALISGHPRGLTPGNPRAFAPRHLQIPPTQGQYSSTKSYHCPSPGSRIE